MPSFKKSAASTIFIAAVLSIVFAAPVRADVPNWFWTAVVDFFGTTNSRLAALESTVAQQQAYISLLESYIEIDETTNPARPTVRIVAANLQVVNGEGSSSTINGLGNIIVGYDEVKNFPPSTCSNGQYETIPSCQGAGFTWSFGYKTGSHNLILGSENNYGSYGGIVAGSQNVINRARASVIGGASNRASGVNSTLIGGFSNRATGTNGVVSGGSGNTASGLSRSVSGGRTNSTTGELSVVSGGWNNLAAGTRSVVSGGENNDATGEDSVVSGGIRNEASAKWSSVSGGADRTSSGEADWRAGTLFENF